MNSRGRRYIRRIVNQAMRHHKAGMRGVWYYSRSSRVPNFEVYIYDDHITVFKIHINSLEYYANINLKIIKHFKNISFLKSYKYNSFPNSRIRDYPAYQLDDKNIYLSPLYYGSNHGKNRLRWVQVIGSRVEEISFDKVFDLLNDDQKREALWNLDILRSYNG